MQEYSLGNLGRRPNESNSSFPFPPTKKKRKEKKKRKAKKGSLRVCFQAPPFLPVFSSLCVWIGPIRSLLKDPPRHKSRNGSLCDDRRWVRHPKPKAFPSREKGRRRGHRGQRHEMPWPCMFAGQRARQLGGDVNHHTPSLSCIE